MGINPNNDGKSIRLVLPELTEERRKELEKRIPEIYEILRKGSIEAQKVAAQTLDEVKRAMKINYFEDAQLIEEQAKRFAEK